MTVRAQVLGDGVEDVSSEAAAGSRSKKGDLLIRVPDADAAIAVEVKAGRVAMAGAQSLERTLRSAMATRGARAAIGVVRAAHLGKRASWLTALPDNAYVVAFEPDLDHGAVALQVAYRVARAALVADAAAADDASSATLRADAVRARARDVLASLDRLRRMKKNATDAGAMLAALRADLDDLDREIRAALRALDADLAA